MQQPDVFRRQHDWGGHWIQQEDRNYLLFMFQTCRFPTIPKNRGDGLLYPMRVHALFFHVKQKKGNRHLWTGINLEIWYRLCCEHSCNNPICFCLSFFTGKIFFYLWSLCLSLSLQQITACSFSHPLAIKCEGLFGIMKTPVLCFHLSLNNFSGA